MATIELTHDNLQETIESSDILLVDFWAQWCGPCRSFGPIFEEASEKHPDITFGKVNTQEEKEVAGTFGIRAIPTLAVFKEQVMVFFQSGALPAPALDELIDKVKGLDMDEVRAKLDEEEKACAEGEEAPS